jgi:uncharacterized protein YjbI with pentapeptide repeats
MKKIWVLLFFITAVLLPACAPNTVYEPINGCEIRPRTQCSELDLSFSNLSGANLSGADLSYANLQEADLSGADLSKSDLSRAYLRAANLSRADLRKADLRTANLSGADLSEANLLKADLSGADLSGANLSRADLREVQYDNNTMFPAGFDLKHKQESNGKLKPTSKPSVTFVSLSCQECKDAGMLLNVWKNAGTNRGGVSFSVAHLTQVEYKSEKVADDGRVWYQVSRQGKTGWIPKDFVSGSHTR